MKSTRSLVIVAAVLLGLALASVGIGYAITNGQPDGNEHPYVALLVFGEETADGFVPYWRCSGSLIGPEVGLPAFSYRDVGVVVLEEPVAMDDYAELPNPGQVNTLKNKTGIDFVGYGVQ